MPSQPLFDITDWPDTTPEVDDGCTDDDMGVENGEDDMTEWEAKEKSEAGESEPTGHDIAEGNSSPVAEMGATEQGAQTAGIPSVWPGSFSPPPTVEEATLALQDLKNILRPPRCGAGYKDPELDLFFHERLEGMKQFLWAYINPNCKTYRCWQAASLQTADALETGPSHARKLCEWGRAFLADRSDLQLNPYGEWNESALEKDETLAHDIHVHLQGIGKYVKAMDLVDFMDTHEMRERTHLKKRINVATAQRWMKKLDYRWTRNPKGQFVDGHERDGVVAYRQGVFLLA